ncbi:MAG: dimethyl sulfoxide reductase anchor subunit, partial [Rubrivivax sp.]|nr:dimethyl sulfoxide reductase anchor subunit [Rubrivivax sp.]
MHPAWSMIFFTTLAGAGQGLLLALVGVDIASRLGLTPAPAPDAFIAGAAIVLLLCGLGMVASVFHLGRPARAWRAATQWRTSWLSREVIVLPAFMATVFAWGLAHGFGGPTVVIGVLAALLALALFLCTGMIYGAVSVIREWATPLTPLNFALLGIASGLTLGTALAALGNETLVPTAALLALGATLIAALVRGATFWRNATLAPKTTLQTAIGVRHPHIVQSSQGQMGGSFNTREFFHGAAAQVLPRLRWTVLAMVFVLPALLLALAGRGTPVAVLAAATVCQYLGLLAERWLF